MIPSQMMVWGPGGYKFMDFMKCGFFLNILQMVVVCLLAGWIFPYDEDLPDPVF